MIRKGFGLWQAIMIILIISGLMIVVLKYSRIAAEHTADTYVRQQLELYMNSSVEQTLLAVSLHTGSECLKTPAIPEGSSNGIKYNANINITRYYLVASAPNNPPAFSTCSIATNIGTDESHGMVMMEVEATATQNGQLVSRILRRTLQRP